jgi:hypothetical protein
MKRAYNLGKLHNPIPYDLVSEIVRFRVKENLAKAEAKRNEKR